MPDGYTFPNKHRPSAEGATIRDRDRDKLNDWEKNFLESIVHFDSPSLKQLETVKMIVAKALVKGSPRRTPRRKRRARQ